MSDYVTLLGAEDVSRAGNSIRQSSDQIAQSTASLVWELSQHRGTMLELIAALDRLTNVKVGE